MTAFDIDGGGIRGDRKIRAADRFDQSITDDHHAVGDLRTARRMHRSTGEGVDAGCVGERGK